MYLRVGILARHDKVQYKGHNSENCSFGVIPLVNLEILSKLLIKYDN